MDTEKVMTANSCTEEKTKQKLNSSKDAISSATFSRENLHLGNSRLRIIQNFILIWLDGNINESSKNFQRANAELRCIVNTINTFTDADQCANFLIEIKDEKVFMIVSSPLGEQFVPLFHELSQLNSIYVFSWNESKYEQWAKEWTKVKGIFTDIEPICDALKRDTRQFDHNSISMSMMSSSDASNRDLNKLDQSFMYTRLLKEILLDMKHDDNARKKLADFYRIQYFGNERQLQKIDEFEQDYHLHSPIWWYTRDSFTYQILNRALRTQDIEIVIKMGFFLRDIHRQIEQLQAEASNFQVPSIVYRGQGLLNSEFEKLIQSKGGLLSFNNFLSTSIDRDVSLLFAESVGSNTELIGILFKIQIVPAHTSTPFAILDNVSYYRDSEKEVLFSMNTVFRVGEKKQVTNRVWEVELALTNDDDDQLRVLTDRIRCQTSGSTEWHRLGQLMIQMGKFDKAAEICQILLDSTADNNENELISLFGQLGAIKYQKGDYKQALSLNEKVLELEQKSLPRNHPDLAITYSNMGELYTQTGDHSTALEFYHKTLEISGKYLDSDDPDLAQIYNNIGSLHNIMGEYSTTLDFFQKTLEIQEKSLPRNHPELAITYNNIGLVQKNMGEYKTALPFYQKALEIFINSLPPNHPSLATSYSNIGGVHRSMKEFSIALSFYQKTLEIEEKSLPIDHPSLAITYNNIGQVHATMGDYSTALSLYQKTLDMWEKSLPSNHSHFAEMYSNIGQVHAIVEDYPTALEFFQKSLEIQMNLPPNYSKLAQHYSNIGVIHSKMKDYKTAISFCERAVDLGKRSLSENHPNLILWQNNLATIQKKL